MVYTTDSTYYVLDPQRKHECEGRDYTNVALHLRCCLSFCSPTFIANESHGGRRDDGAWTVRRLDRVELLRARLPLCLYAPRHVPACLHVVVLDELDVRLRFGRREAEGGRTAFSPCDQSGGLHGQQGQAQEGKAAHTGLVQDVHVAGSTTYVGRCFEAARVESGAGRGGEGERIVARTRTHYFGHTFYLCFIFL